jgi:nitrate/nitrite transporter NarK
VGLALVFAVLPFMGMLAKPLAGWLADRFSLQKTIFMASIVLSGTGTVMLFYTLGISS